VLVDFWFNHFNIYIAKGADRYLTTSYEREAIRKHAMGKFEDLLIATAKDPAMLFYLDNFQSVGPNSIAGKRSGSAFFAKGNGGQLRRQRFRQDTERPQLSSETTANRMSEDDDVQKGAPKRGLNENYARELMELHTMGVDGGYTQHDIVEVAKVFTGWTARQPRLGGDFEFNSRIHEPGNKKVLGVVIKEDGENEGKKVLHMLATHPATAKFISRKLAMRFVSDAPPQALVDRMAATFLKSEGDIKQVLRTLFKSPEFWAQDAYRAKVKTPLEFVVSAVRVTGTEVKNAQVLARTLQTMGMPLYGMQPPTGYSMKAEAWVNSAALLNRMNFGLALATGRLRGLDINGSTLLDRPSSNDTEDVFATLAKALLAGDVSRQTQETVRKQMDESQKADSQSVMPEKHSRFSLATGMILGSPEFQRR
jgi:uncharacterized protein (DUF1800 family)